MAIEAGRGYRVEVGTALAAALTVTAVSRASEAVVTATNTLTAGTWVMFGAVDGMFELSFQVARVKSPSGTQFTLEGVDSTNWGVWTAGTCQAITTWSTLGQATGVDFGAPSVDELDITSLLDVTKMKLAGLVDQPTVSINLFTDYSVAVQTSIDTAAYAGTVLPWRFRKASGQLRGLAAVPSAIGESAQVNQPISGTLSLIRYSKRDIKYVV